MFERRIRFGVEETLPLYTCPVVSLISAISVKVPFDKWIESVFNSIPGGEAAAKTWRSAHNKEDTIEQSFRRIGLQEALALL